MHTATLHLGFAGFGAARATTARDDIELVGIDGARELLGIAAPLDDVVH